MSYRINISKHGRHFFATASHSVTNQQDLKKVLPEIVERFPEEEGFAVSVSQEQTIGLGLELAKVLAACTSDKALAQELDKQTSRKDK